MKKVESVWAELSAKKKAFSSGKLELSALDDIKSSQDLLEQGVGEADDIINRMKEVGSALNTALDLIAEAQGDIETLGSALSDDFNTAEAALDEFQTLANELGINADDNADWKNLDIFLRNDFSDIQMTLETYFDDLQEVRGSINFKY